MIGAWWRRRGTRLFCPSLMRRSIASCSARMRKWIGSSKCRFGVLCRLWFRSIFLQFVVIGVWFCVLRKKKKVGSLCRNSSLYLGEIGTSFLFFSSPNWILDFSWPISDIRYNHYRMRILELHLIRNSFLVIAALSPFSSLGISTFFYWNNETIDLIEITEQKERNIRAKQKRWP